MMTKPRIKAISTRAGRAWVCQGPSATGDATTGVGLTPDEAWRFFRINAAATGRYRQWVGRAVRPVA